MFPVNGLFCLFVFCFCLVFCVWIIDTKYFNVTKPPFFNILLKWLDCSFRDIDPLEIIRVVCKRIWYKILIKEGLDWKAFGISQSLIMDWWSLGYLKLGNDYALRSQGLWVNDLWWPVFLPFQTSRQDWLLHLFHLPSIHTHIHTHMPVFSSFQ